MLRDHPAKHDPRSVHDLINAALMEVDEEIAWNAVEALHWRATREVLQRAQELCGSPCFRERCLCANILSQLGVEQRAFPEEAVDSLLDMLAVEQDVECLSSIIMALAHYTDPRIIPAISMFAEHPDEDVRWAVTNALGGDESPSAIALQIRLSTDPADAVRDWATFCLGKLQDCDTPEIREALAARLHDSDDETRGEALVGLAMRHDPRAIDAMAIEGAPAAFGEFFDEAEQILRDAHQLSTVTSE